MFVRRQTLIFWLAVVGLVASSAIAQEAPRERGRRDRNRQDNANAEAQDGQNDGRRERRRGERGEGRGEDRRGFGGDRGRFGGPPREFTPEQREQFYGGMVDRYMERYSRNYELTDQQKEQVRARLEEVKTQQRSWGEQHSGEFQTLRQEFWQLRSSGGQTDPQKYQELRQRFDALRTQSPLFNDDQVAEGVEKLLPPEQAKAGRERRLAESAEREQQREQRRQEWEQRRQQPEEPAQQETPAQDGQPQDQAPAAPPGAAAPEGQHQHGRDHQSHRQDWRQRHQSGDGGHNERGHSEGGRGAAGAEQPQFVQEGGQNTQSTTVIPENPVGPWEQYVRDFVRKFNLDDAQQATAQSVLREVMKRRVSYEQSHRNDFDAARRIEAGGDREKRLADLNKPVVSMFEELKARLNRIPSSAQRQAAGVVSVAASRPAFSTVITTRPASERKP